VDVREPVLSEIDLLDHTFVHIQGIGEKTEKDIWARGILTWTDFLVCPQCVLSEVKDHLIREGLRDSIAHREEIGFFAKRLPSSEMWRLYDSFRRRVVYLDIETTGGYMGADEITVVGTYDGACARSFVCGANLKEFERYISDFDLVVTFSGSCFDLPFIRRSFPNITLPPGHIDLRFPLKRLGYRGGLKKVEKEIGLERAAGIRHMDGYDAVRLWREYEWGDHCALETLLEYNKADVVNLEPLMELVNREMKAMMLPHGHETRGAMEDTLMLKL
jgi:uncharacterized protein